MTGVPQNHISSMERDLEAGDKLTWEVRGGRVAITTERPALYGLEGFIKHGPDALTAIARARKTRGRI